jgi:hypothetical protein
VNLSADTLSRWMSVLERHSGALSGFDDQDLDDAVREEASGGQLLAEAPSAPATTLDLAAEHLEDDDEGARGDVVHVEGPVSMSGRRPNG